MSSVLFWQNAKAGLRDVSLGAMRLAIPAAAIIGLSACVVAPPPPRTVAVPAPPPQKVFVYPANGQSAEQTDRDRYECHVWAVQQTGVDPSRADANPYERVVVQPANPPGSATAAGAIGGAILGALIAGPRDTGAGLVLGGITGAVVGSTVDPTTAPVTPPSTNPAPASRCPAIRAPKIAPPIAPAAVADPGGLAGWTTTRS